MEETTDIIYGKNAVMEALIAGEREINKILISKNIHSDNKLNKIKELAKENGVVFQFVAKEKLEEAGIDYPIKLEYYKRVNDDEVIKSGGNKYGVIIVQTDYFHKKKLYYYPYFRLFL